MFIKLLGMLVLTKALSVGENHSCLEFNTRLIKYLIYGIDISTYQKYCKSLLTCMQAMQFYMKTLNVALHLKNMHI